MTPELVGVIGLAVLVILLLLKVPVGVAMILTAVAGYAYIINPAAAVAKLGIDPFRSVTNYGLSVIPMFILMGMFLTFANYGSDLFEGALVLFGKVRGSLAMGTIGASALFAAVCGSAVATALTISTVAIPEMRKRNYSEALAAGVVAVGGTLGILIPPSAPLVLYAIISDTPIGPTLIAGFVPGIMTALLLMITVWIMVRRRPELAPVGGATLNLSKVQALGKIWAIPVIFVICLGGIYIGAFTPTEGGAVGAFAALLLGVFGRRFKWKDLLESVTQAIQFTASVFIIIVGGTMFGYFLAVTKIPMLLTEYVQGLNVAPPLIILAICLVYFALGCLMDELAILVIMTPIMYPIVISLGYNGIWFGVVTIMMLLIGLLTPPVGLVSFIVSGVSKIPIATVFRGVTPFWFTLAIATILVILFPNIALFLPNLMK